MFTATRHASSFVSTFACRASATADNRILVAVRQDFTGAFSGRALLIFPETSSLELIRAAVGRSLSLRDVIDLQDEALSEIGNIILNSRVATIANLLQRSLAVSLPVVVRGDGKRVFDVEESKPTYVLFGPTTAGSSPSIVPLASAATRSFSNARSSP
jgi:chemotaxis protein CheC